MASIVICNIKSNLSENGKAGSKRKMFNSIGFSYPFFRTCSLHIPLALSLSSTSLNFLGTLTRSRIAECESTDPEFTSQLDLTVSRLKVLIGATGPELVPRKTKNGVEVFAHKDGKLENGFPVARVGTTLINAPMEDVAACWWHFNARKEWDSVNTTESQHVRDEGPDRRLVYLRAKAKPMISPRDFVFVICKIPGHCVGAAPGSTVFVQVNSPEKLPPEKGAVRADVNSMLILEPVGLMQTKATYVVEMDARGWIPTYAVNAAADDLPLTLGVMRDYLESKMAALTTGSEEEAARALVKRRRSEEDKDKDCAATLVSSMAASREDLLQMRSMLQKKLRSLPQEEKELGIKLTDLRRKIEADLKKVNDRLK